MPSKSIHVAANGNISFLFYDWVVFCVCVCVFVYVCVCVYAHHIFFIHFSVLFIYF